MQTGEDDVLIRAALMRHVSDHLDTVAEGEGRGMSIRRRIWTTSRGEAREGWLVDFRDTQGRRRSKAFKRKRDAMAYAATAAVEVAAGVHVVARDSITLAAAAVLWIASGEAAGLERSTLDQRRQHVRHITAIAGGRRLAGHSPPMVRQFEDELRAAGHSPAMCRKIRVSLGSIFADSQARGLAMRNPVREVRAQRRPGSEDGRRDRLQPGRDIPLPGEIRAFLAALPGNRFRPVLMTAVFTGLRASELRGLRWSDVDLDAGRLHVRQRVDRYNEAGRPKTGAGVRTVPMPAPLLAILTEWREICPQGAAGLVFPNGKGNPESLANIRNRGLVLAWRSAGISRRYGGLHALRHWYASWCINAKPAGLGMNVKAVSERLGHSSIKITLDTYAHLFPNDDGGALDDGAASLMS